MAAMESFLRANWFIIVFSWIFIALFAVPLRGIVRSLLAASGNTFARVSRLLAELETRVTLDSNRAVRRVSSLFEGLGALVAHVAGWGDIASRWGSSHATEAWKHCSSDDEDARTHALGAIACSVLLVIFLWADFSLVANALFASDPRAVIPQIFTYKTVPLIVASTVSAFTLGAFWADIYDTTNFVRWPHAALPFLRLVIPVLFSLSVLISFGISGERVVNFVVLPLGFRTFLERAHAVAQLAVIIPLLTTTVLLSPAFRIVQLAPVLLFATFGAVGALLRGFLRLVILVLHGLGELSGASVQIAATPVRWTIELLAVLFSALNDIVREVQEPLLHVIDLLASVLIPFAALVAGLRRTAGSPFPRRATERQPGGETRTTASDDLPSLHFELSEQLNSVLGFAQLLAQRPNNPLLTEAQRRDIENIIGAGADLRDVFTGRRRHAAVPARASGLQVTSLGQETDTNG